MAKGRPVPKKVDHDARRREIADAVLRLAVDDGLEAVSLRHVAAAAGISMGAVQHYFRTKDEMLAFALGHQAQRREARIIARLGAAGRPPTVHEIVRTSMLEVLATDEVSRADYLAGLAFLVRGLRSPGMAATLADGSGKLHDFFAGLLGQAQEAGEIAAGVDVREEAMMLWSVVEGQCVSLLIGERSAAEAEATVDYYLTRLFPPRA